MKHNPDVITLADKSAEQNEQINWQAYNPASMATAFKNLPLKGNIIPLAWFIHIKFANGKPDVNAILILADIVYWYRPVVIRDQDTGDIIGHRHKFKSSLLQKSYQHYAELFGFSKRQVREAMYRLEKQGLIQRVLRTVPTPCTVLQNVLFIALNLPKLTAVTLRTGEIIKTDANNESVQIID